MLKKSRKRPYFEFDVSENPFAYIRGKKDVNVFIANINRVIKEKEDLTIIPHILRLLWIVTMYVYTSCRTNEHSLKSIVKLLKTMIDEDVGAGISIFSVIIEDGPKDLFEKYNYFIREVNGMHSEMYNNVVSKSIQLLETVSTDTLISGLKDGKIPLQAVLHSGEDRYDVWFCYSYSNTTSCTFFHDNDNQEDLYHVSLPHFLIEEEANGELRRYFHVSKFCLRDVINQQCGEILKAVVSSKNEHESSLEVPSELEIAIINQLFDDVTKESSSDRQEIQRNQYSKFSTAIHEAGHAVAAYLQDIPLKGVTIVSSREELGSCSSDVVLSAEIDAIVNYAGGAAENIYYNTREINCYGCATDFEFATKRLKNVIFADVAKAHHLQEYIFVDVNELGLTNNESPYVLYETIRQCKECFEKAYQLIEKNMDLVEALAKELMIKKTMCGEEVVALLHKVQAERVLKEPNEEHS